MRSMMLLTSLILASTAAGQQKRQVIPGDFNTGSARAVTIRDSALAHTSQLLPLNADGKLPDGAAAQAHQALENLGLALAEVRSSLDQAVKINWYVAKPEVVPAVIKAMARRFDDSSGPAVSFVVTPLIHPDALVAADAVAPCAESVKAVKRFTCGKLRGQLGESHVAVLPDGARVYVSGQAEKGSDLKEATRKTLESLRDTLTYLRLKDEHVVQVKAFLTPMTSAADVIAEMERFFGKGKMPPIVLVEWRSSLPIEIELIAAAGPARENMPDVVEYLAPPALKQSPIFSRIVKVNFGPTIYISGIYAKQNRDVTADVASVFQSLEGVLKEAGSDFKHLVKATYYVSTEPASQALNFLRPRFYDAKRPPAASKAMVAGVGRLRHDITLDMITVPTMPVTRGSPEAGHELTAGDAADGWISLYDGKTAFGWEGAKVDDGLLVGGRTTSQFGMCAVRAEFVRGGKILVEDKARSVEPGVFSLPRCKPGRFALMDGAAVRSFAVRPLNLQPLFNKEDMDGWKRIDRSQLPEEKRPKWTVEDGKLIAVGGPGALEYAKEQFGDLVMQVEVRTRARHVNGGVFFRCIPGDFMNGYEMQIYNRCKDGDPAQPVFWTTGGIDDRQNARRLVSRDLEPFLLTVIARGPHIATWVNGHQVTDWTDDRSPDANPRKGRRVEAGTIQLQAHDPETDLEIRAVRAAALK